MRTILCAALALAACVTQQDPEVPTHRYDFDPTRPVFGATDAEVCDTIASASCEGAAAAEGCHEVLLHACCEGTCGNGLVVVPTEAGWHAAWAACFAGIRAGSPAACFDVMP